MILIKIFIFITVISTNAHSANVNSAQNSSDTKDISFSQEQRETQSDLALPALDQVYSVSGPVEETPRSFTPPPHYLITEERQPSNRPLNRQNIEQNEDDFAKQSYQILSNLVDENDLTETVVLFKDTKDALKSADQAIQKTFSEIQILQTLSSLSSAERTNKQVVRENTSLVNQTNEYNDLVSDENFIQGGSDFNTQQVSSILNLENLLTIILVFIIAAVLYKLASFILLRNPYN